MATTCVPTEDSVYIYVILVNGNISKDGYFTEENKSEAERIAKKYEADYTVSLKKIKRNS